MNSFSAQTIWRLEEDELLKFINSGRLAPEKRKIWFYTPSFAYHRTTPNSLSKPKYPTISVTGQACTLGCKHCGGKVLETMQPAESPEKLFALAQQLKRDGAAGCLVSGGCLPDGSVPLYKFIPVIGKMKRELGLTVTVHTGIINEATALKLRKAEIDAALIDIVGSNNTLKHVLNLKITTKSYEDSLRALSSAKLRFVPHVIVGLQEGGLQGEYEALQMIGHYEPSTLVIIAFMPIRGTKMENVKPPKPIDIARVVATARVMFPSTPLALGCMRPKGKDRAETDLLALKAGVDAIAFPTEDAVTFAQARGSDVAFSYYCCSQIYADTGLRSGSK
jgi:lipoyl synthase